MRTGQKLHMDASGITALAALAGAAIGGLTSVVASWLTQRAQARTQRLAQDQLRRQEIYKEIHFGGFEIIYRRAPERQSRRFRLDGALLGAKQNARPVLGNGGRQR
jgi:hypothetical protein